MSRIGNKEIIIPEDVKVNISEDNTLDISGPKGSLQKKFNSLLDIKFKDTKITVKRPNNDQFMQMIHGTTSSLIINMVKGVKEGYKIELEIVGVGYKTSLKDGVLILNLGFSHPINFKIPADINVEVPNANTIIITGIDKQKVSETAANIRRYKKPEPYKGKGIKYKGEKIMRKEGKTAAKK